MNSSNLEKKKESTPVGGMTYEEIGRAMGITKQGVRKIEKRAIRKVKKILSSRYGISMRNPNSLFGIYL